MRRATGSKTTTPGPAQGGPGVVVWRGLAASRTQAPRGITRVRKASKGSGPSTAQAEQHRAGQHRARAGGGDDGEHAHAVDIEAVAGAAVLAGVAGVDDPHEPEHVHAVLVEDVRQADGQAVGGVVHRAGEPPVGDVVRRAHAHEHVGGLRVTGGVVAPRRLPHRDGLREQRVEGQREAAAETERDEVQRIGEIRRAQGLGGVGAHGGQRLAVLAEPGREVGDVGRVDHDAGVGARGGDQRKRAQSGDASDRVHVSSSLVRIGARAAADSLLRLEVCDATPPRASGKGKVSADRARRRGEGPVIRRTLPHAGRDPCSGPRRDVEHSGYRRRGRRIERRVLYPARVPLWLLIALIAYALMGVLSFAAYGVDKRRASNRAWRTSERALHTIDLLGGVLGGLIAQRVWNHKRRKRTFVAITWVIAALHAAAWITLWRLRR
ncbi:MAG: DUF1294 domain-containing protein [Phycisphaerales bacterium]|nr:MAG: DUF1294 domain-containing protein [Phycisphaerales bacterium]